MASRPEDSALREAVVRHAGTIDAAFDFVQAHPELSHQEVECSAYLADTLEGLGLRVERGIAEMPTAFRATLEGRGGPGRNVGIVALYDAVSAVPAEGGIVAVHSCGHGPIAASVVGAAAALADERDQLAGSVVIMGCPADEIHATETAARGGGKTISVDAGAWDDIDAALYAHPEFEDTAWTASLWMRRDMARLSAKRDLGEDAAQPVLDFGTAAIAAVEGLPAGRAMLERLELDGDVEAGGGLVGRATYLIWAEDEAGLDELAGTIRGRVGADVEWTLGRPVPSVAPDPSVRAAVEDALTASGRPPNTDPPPLPFATDFGAITRRVPSALIGVARAEGWAFHTPDGGEQFASEAGRESARGMAEVLALTAARLTAAD